MRKIPREAIVQACKAQVLAADSMAETFSSEMVNNSVYENLWQQNARERAQGGLDSCDISRRRIEAKQLLESYSLLADKIWNSADETFEDIEYLESDLGGINPVEWGGVLSDIIEISTSNHAYKLPIGKTNA